MGMRVFIGDVLIKKSFLRSFMFDTETSKLIPFDPPAKDCIYAVSGSMILNRIYRSVYLDGTPISPLAISMEAEPVGSICEMLSIVGVYNMGEGRYAPAIVVYPDGFFENISTSPVKIVLAGTPKIWRKAVGVVEAKEKLPIRRDYAIMQNPTTEILARKCGLDNPFTAKRRKAKAPWL